MASDARSKRPNFLIILADDLGYSDIGCFGAEIQTPNIDHLAQEGVRLLNHHAAAACSPTRAMLLTGTDAHLGGLGTLIEYKNHDNGRKRWGGKAGYEGYLNADVATVPEILSDHGYYTVMSGKWHLGLRASQGPWKRGFKDAFAMLPGCCNHYGWEPVQEKFPIGGRPVHAEKGKKVTVSPNKVEDPNGFYSSNFYASRLIDYFKGRSPEDKTKPFFAFLPFTAPHWPLQCSKAQRDKYRGMYDDGPYALRERRLQKLIELGIIDRNVIPHAVETKSQGVGEWDTLTAEEKKLSSRAMETYAGMVDAIDLCVGKVIDYLKETGEYDDTLIVFMSDNGAEGAALEAIPVMGDRIYEAIHKYYDNSYENIGAWNSFTWLGPLWAQASTAPSRLFKCYPSQGGILVPCIIKPAANTFLPAFSQATANRAFSTVMDFAPTILEIAGVTLPPASTKLQPWPPRKDPIVQPKTTFRGRDVHAIRGKSMLPFFGRGEKAEDGGLWAIHASTEPVGWELFARAALRKGNWKIVHFPKSRGGKGNDFDLEGWELFDVVEDPGETRDLAETHGEKLKELLQHWEDYVAECGLVWGETAQVSGLPMEEAPGFWEDELDLQKAWMGAKCGECPVPCE